MYNFEIHITTECNNFDIFKEECKTINAKAIIIDLFNSKQVMTSKTLRSNNLDNVIKMAYNDAKMLTSKITRVKIESCPKFIKETNCKYDYLEIHVPCFTNKLKCVNTVNNWHKSKNEFKDNITFMTCRVKDESYIDSIDNDINNILYDYIDHDNFKHHYEYAVYDSNVDLDYNWI